MAENYYVQDSLSGIITADTSQIQAGVESEIKAIFGNDIDLTPETPQGRLVEVLTAERSGVVGFNAANASQLNLTYSTGLFLDAVGSFFGVSRIGKSQSRVRASITGVAGTFIEAGSKVKSLAGDEFYLESSLTLPSPHGADFLSVEYGAIPCEVNTLTTIVSSVLGWETVNNSAEPAPLGADQESDAAYRIRIKASRYSGTGFVADISSKLNAVKNVLSSFVYDNGTNSPVTYDSIEIAPHSIVVVVDGGADADIADAIYTTKSAGCGYTVITDLDTTVYVEDGQNNVSYPVIFNRPEEVEIDIEITVKAGEVARTDLTTAIKDAISSWAAGQVEGVDGLKIGQDVSPFEIASAVSIIVPTPYVKLCEICVHEGVPSTDEVTITSAQVARVTQSNITVTIV